MDPILLLLHICVQGGGLEKEEWGYSGVLRTSQRHTDLLAASCLGGGQEMKAPGHHSLHLKLLQAGMLSACCCQAPSSRELPWDALEAAKGEEKDKWRKAAWGA